MDSTARSYLRVGSRVPFLEFGLSSGSMTQALSNRGWPSFLRSLWICRFYADLVVARK